MHARQRHTQFFLSNARSESDGVRGHHQITLRSESLDQLKRRPHHRLHAEFENRAKSLARMPQVWMVEGGMEIVLGSQFREFKARLFDHRLKHTISRQCHPVAALPQAHAQAHEGVNIAVASEGDEQVVHVQQL